MEPARLFLSRWSLSLLVLLVLFGSSRPTSAYSVLTHELIIDLTWNDSIQPLLLRRFPNLTREQLRDAHAYAYGGCVIQDLGYYPFGQPSFSDLLHYVRPGDFVRALFRDAKNANDVAFAIGALSHYLGDSIGHPEAVNIAVGKAFPALAEKYGPNVNYAEGPHQHVRAEFGFDVNDVVQHRIAPEHYLDHIGFAVPVPLLAKAFYETYGLDLGDVLGHKRPQLKGYRYSVRTLLPRIAYAEGVLHHKRMGMDPASGDVDNLNRQIAALAASDNWASYRGHAGIGTHLLAGVIFIIPKFGPLQDLKIKDPTPTSEVDYVHSLLQTVDVLRTKVRNATRSDGLPNLDLDTGLVIRPGTYLLCDTTYAQLLHKVTSKPDDPIPFGIKRDLEAYFADPAKATYLKPAQLAQVRTDLPILKTISTQAQYPDTAFLPEPAADMPPQHPQTQSPEPAAPAKKP